jgi:hypothetical protein
MKKVRSYWLLLATLGLLFSTCTKTIHDRRSRETVTPDSREYFGCRLNGVGFVSEASTGTVSGYCSYEQTYKSNSGYTFKIFSDKVESGCKSSTIGITLDSVQLVAGARYDLGSKGDKKNFGTLIITPASSQSTIVMHTADGTGTDYVDNYVTIKSIDTVKRIVTGTFNFTMKDANGHLYQITGGIFDRHFTH